MKQRLSQYIAENYAPGSEPDPRTVVSRGQKGQLEGVDKVFMEGGLWYVYLSSPTGDPVADSILRTIRCR